MENDENKNAEENKQDSTEEINQNTQPEEEKADKTPESEKRQPESSSTENDEVKKTEQPAENKTDNAPKAEGSEAIGKKEKKGKGRTVLKIIGIAVLAAVCGFGGGYAAGNISAEKKLNDFEEERGEQFEEFGDFSGQMPGSFNNETNTNKAALGIYVEEGTDGVSVVGFTDGSNAEDAGLETGDIITSLDNTEVSSLSDIREFLADKEAGDKVKVTVERNGEEKTVTIELIENQPQSGKPGNNDSHSDFPDDSSSQMQG